MAMLRIMDPMFGDKRIEWTKEDKNALKNAKALFEEKINAKWIAFKVLKDKTAKMIKKFDPKAETIVLTPPVGGG